MVLEKVHPSTWHKHISPGPRLPWKHVGSGEKHVLPQLEQLYWTGVAQELQGLILMLRKWQLPEFCDILPDENVLIDGFDTFINQVVPRTSVKCTVNQDDSSVQVIPRKIYIDSLTARMVEVAQETRQKKVRTAVHKRLNQRPAKKDTISRRRARLLLQAAGLLDIEKLIEHRPTRGRLGSNTPGAPQLTVNGELECGCPILTTLLCSECKQSIHGSRFESEGEKICEDCYWRNHYGDPTFAKHYQDSVLHTLAELPNRGRVCFANKKHRQNYSRPSPFLDAGGLYIVADAKYNIQRGSKAWNLRGNRNLSSVNRTHQFQTLAENQIIGTSVREDPFKDVHMSLRVGPLVMENGMAHTKKGAFITLREPTFQHIINRGPEKEVECLAVSPESDRQLWYQLRPVPSVPKRFKAVLKQVVGTPFSGSSFSDTESEIIDLIVRASESDKVEGVVFLELQNKLETLLRPWVSVYLESITERLLDPSIRLTWDTRNNCQQFCDSLLNWNTFGCLTPEPTVALANGTLLPLYRFSFVCRPGSLPKAPFRAGDIQPDVPYGFTEEYLRRFWYGGYNGPDLIDWLQEYWYDWSALQKPPYPHQTHFPWDCTEAVRRYPITCGQCSLAKHLWACPFDSWSIIALHLLRDKPLYPEHDRRAPEAEPRWMHDRIMLLLSALDALLSGAAAMSAEPLFRQSTSWLHQGKSKMQDRVRLGSIFRAQPHSHAQELRPPDAYFVADWSRLKNDQAKREAYEKAREERHDPAGMYSTVDFFTRASEHAPPVASSSGNYLAVPTSGFHPYQAENSTVCGTRSCAGGCSANCSADCSTGSCGNNGVGCGGGGGGGGGPACGACGACGGD